MPNHEWVLFKRQSRTLITSLLELAKLKNPSLTYSSADIKFHVFEDDVLGHVSVIAVPITVQEGSFKGKTISFCVQIQDLDPSSDTDVTPSTTKELTEVNKSQLHVKFNVPGESTDRLGVVWLK